MADRGNVIEFPTVEEVPLEPLARLIGAIRGQATQLDRRKVSGIVRAYYQLQRPRIAFDAQARALRDEGLPDDLPDFFYRQLNRLEGQVRATLGEWASQFDAGQWLQRIHGVGPVISAGLLSHLDITRASAASHFWSFAGSNPEMVWNRGERRPFNADLKSLCWRMSDSMVKHRNDTDRSGNYVCYYGRHYQAKKEQLIARNDRGGFAELAAKTLAERTFRDLETKAVYEAGRIPDGRVDAQARRWTWKLILCHLHTVMCVEAGIEPPKPYIITYLGHVDRIEIPA
jgi:hypothetical protein